MLAAPAVAMVAASEMVCGTPGVSVRVEGVAVMPAGSRPVCTATLPVKLSIAFAVTVKVRAAALSTRVRAAGARVSEKSGDGLPAGRTASAVVILCEMVPAVPVAVRVTFEAAALEAAVSRMDCAAPGSRVKLEGVAVTACGRPLSVTAMGVLKPPDGGGGQTDGWARRTRNNGDTGRAKRRAQNQAVPVAWPVEPVLLLPLVPALLQPHSPSRIKTGVERRQYFHQRVVFRKFRNSGSWQRGVGWTAPCLRLLRHAVYRPSRLLRCRS